MSQGGVNAGDGPVMAELRNIGNGLNEVKVSIARLEAGQASMTQRMETYERKSERLEHAVQDFDRFRQGAGVKLGAGVWLAALGATIIITALVSVLVSSLSSGRAEPPAKATERREPGP